MFIKIMSGENMPDDSTHKSYKMVGQVRCFEFKRFDNLDTKEETACVKVWHLDGSDVLYPVTGNVYIMNEKGKTIDVYAHAPYWDGVTN